MRSTSFYRPCALLAKAALIADPRRCFGGIVVENDHGTVILSGSVTDSWLAREAGALVAKATGSLVVNHIFVPG